MKLRIQKSDSGSKQEVKGCLRWRGGLSLLPGELYCNNLLKVTRLWIDSPHLPHKMNQTFCAPLGCGVLFWAAKLKRAKHRSFNYSQCKTKPNIERLQSINLTRIRTRLGKHLLVTVLWRTQGGFFFLSGFLLSLYFVYWELHRTYGVLSRSVTSDPCLHSRSTGRTHFKVHSNAPPSAK